MWTLVVIDNGLDCLWRLHPSTTPPAFAARAAACATRSYPPSAKSSGTETSMGVSLCRGQHSARLGPMLSERSGIESTSAHMGTGLEVSELPIMYIPCRARLSRSLMRLEVFKNPHFCSSLLRTSETTMTFASSPWKLSIVAILKALSSVVFWTWAWPSVEASNTFLISIPNNNLE